MGSSVAGGSVSGSISGPTVATLAVELGGDSVVVVLLDDGTGAVELGGNSVVVVLLDDGTGVDWVVGGAVLLLGASVVVVVVDDDDGTTVVLLGVVSTVLDGGEGGWTDSVAVPAAAASVVGLVVTDVDKVVVDKVVGGRVEPSPVTGPAVLAVVGN